MVISLSRKIPIQHSVVLLQLQSALPEILLVGLLLKKELLSFLRRERISSLLPHLGTLKETLLITAALLFLEHQ